MRARTIRSVIATVVIAGGILAGGTAAQAAESDATSRSVTITSPSCVEQVEAIAAAKRIDPAAGLLLCSGTVKVVESRVEVASTTDVLSFARSERLSQRETDALVASAASGGISYRNWTHSYWGGSLVEKHTGRTYWDGKKAWIASYRGFSGKHSCHSEGGIAVGWAVTPLGCSKPKAGSSADAYYRFDAHAAFKGSPITLNIGLHYRTAASGKTTTWQVGG